MIDIECPCGEYYHANDTDSGKKIRCSNCHRILIIEIAPKQIDTSSKNYNPVNTAKSSSSYSMEKIYLSIAGFFIFSILLLVIGNIYSPNPRPKNPRSLPLGAEPLGKGKYYGSSSLIIDNGSTQDGLVRIIQVTGFNYSEEEIRNVYVPAKQKAQIDHLPAGHYKIKAASGLDWNDSLHRFNYDLSFIESDLLDIQGTVTVTLHKVSYGNLHYKDINNKEFSK